MIIVLIMTRSVGGSYDNEGVAIFALIFCFYLWVKSVHTGECLELEINAESSTIFDESIPVVLFHRII